MIVEHARPEEKGWRAATLAGLAYTAVVFAVAFIVGAIRVTLVAPRLGDLVAVLLEAPIVLAVSWRLSRWCVSRFHLSSDALYRGLMGAVAFVFLMALELAVSVLAFGETAEHYFAKWGTTPGIVGLATQVVFAMIPWVQCFFLTESRRR
ncbi:MAG: hypothetical protein ABI664_21995 [bacterium]